jgi:hypothetical protein
MTHTFSNLPQSDHVHMGSEAAHVTSSLVIVDAIMRAWLNAQDDDMWKGVFWRLFGITVKEQLGSTFNN